MSELERELMAGELDAETVGAKLAAMVETEAAAAEAETPEDEDEEGAEEDEAMPTDPLTAALATYVGTVMSILGDDAQVTPCAYCQGKGFNAIELLPDTHSHPCEQCNGRGEVTTGSLVPGNEARMCRDCRGAGFIDNAPELVTMPMEVTAVETQLLSESEIAEIVRKAQEAAGANAA